MADIIQLHPTPALAGYLRIGHVNHKMVEALHAAGRFPYRRVVFEARYLDKQLDLLTILKANGCEIVLDPNFAEMVSDGHWRGPVRHLPWANPDRPWQPSDFTPGRNADVAKSMAEFCVRHGVSAILAPNHLIESVADSWRILDERFCQTLRDALDRQGGRTIAIDYQLLVTNALLRDCDQREQLVRGLADLPIENVWLRVSGFGATATGAATCRFIDEVRKTHSLNLPLVADSAGGFSALASLAFGAVGGISHGIGQKESFNVYHWKHPSSGGGGNKRRIYISELDRYFDEDQLTSIFAARGGRARLACNNANCCPGGIDDMVANAHFHFIFQRNAQLESLSAEPENRRSEHFLRRHLDVAVRSGRRGARLKISNAKVATAINQARDRLIRLYDSLTELDSRGDSTTRSRPVAFRGGGGLISAMLGR
ncbi:MAG: hypothetical protein WA417_20060 [Stellaceae bacterium]